MISCYLNLGRIYVGNSVIELLKKDGIKITKRVIKTIESVLDEYRWDAYLTIKNGLGSIRSKIPDVEEVYLKVKERL
jgi:hypothetical protein